MRGALDLATKALRTLGSPYHLAGGLLDQAEHLAGSSNEAAAQPLAAEAHTIAERLGAAPLIERARALARSPVTT